MPRDTWIGVDYGSKYSGNTALCYGNLQNINIFQVLKTADADAYILDFVVQNRPDFMMLDAPLSLPWAYYNSAYSDFMYRQADRALNAMSPMFLGGLTARAIALKRKIEPIPVFETYPAALIKHLDIKTYPKKKAPITQNFIDELGFKINIDLPKFDNMHQVDAFLAWYSGFRKQNNATQKYGNALEGLIWV